MSGLDNLRHNSPLFHVSLPVGYITFNKYATEDLAVKRRCNRPLIA